MSPLNALSTVWRQYRPRPSPHTGTRQLVSSLRDGASLGEALQLTSGMLAEFIVDVKDSLRRQLLEASVSVQDAPVGTALRSMAKAVNDDTFVQHLINALLKATDLYVESMI